MVNCASDRVRSNLTRPTRYNCGRGVFTSVKDGKLKQHSTTSKKRAWLLVGFAMREQATNCKVGVFSEDGFAYDAELNNQKISICKIK